MATISNTPRPGYVWDSTDNVWYPIGVGGHAHPDYITQATAVNPTIIDAKGDIITATAADTPARLAVGNNGETLVANSAASTGLSYQGNQAAGKNFVINGGLDIWQRGTSFTGTAPYYNADRWSGARGGAASGGTWSQQAITGNLGTTPAQGVLYSLRVSRDSGNTSTAVLQTVNGFESANSIPLAGQTVVMSFYAKAGANFSAASNALAVKLVTGTGINQNYLTASYTGLANAISTTATLTTSWQRFQYTATLPTTTTEVALDFTYTPVGTAGAADNFEITGVQLEVGSVATQFARTGGTFQGELAACQRYFLKYGGNQAYETFPGVLLSYSTTQGEGPIALKSTMRTTPTVAFSTLKISDVASYNLAVTNLTITTNTSGPDTAYLVFTVASGASSGKTNLLRTDGSTAGYLTFSAEL